MANTIAENAPVRVRFTHLGVNVDGTRRPVCRPSDLKLQMVTNEDKVTCPHCIERLEEFQNWMALQIASGRIKP